MSTYFSKSVVFLADTFCLVLIVDFRKGGKNNARDGPGVMDGRVGLIDAGVMSLS